MEETLRSAQVTHYDPRCGWSAVVINVAIAHALEGRAVALTALAAALDEAGAPAAAGEAVRSADGAALHDLDLGDPDSMGYTLKAMQVGLWALMTRDSLEDALVRVVGEGGDTDTNGAVAGAVLGAVHGASAIPHRWLERIPERQRLELLADQLLARA